MTPIQSLPDWEVNGTMGRVTPTQPAQPRVETLTVMFTDLADSTGIRVRLGEERADTLRRAHDALLTGAVTAEGGHVVKGLGDGVLAVFSSASDAVAAAVRIQQDAYARARESPEDALEVRVGLSAGDVSLEDGDCFGTPVIEASRLCAVALGGQILAAELVRLLARGRGGYVFTAAGERELKGLPDAVPVVAVGWDPPELAAAPLSFPSRLMPQSLAPLCGRDTQLEVLLEAWKQAGSGQRRVLLISGEPGIGKTRLAAELSRRAYDGGAVVLCGRSDEGLGVPFQPFVEALEQVVADGASLESLGCHPGELVRLAPDLAALHPGLEPPLSSDPDTERYRLFDAVVSWLAATSHRAGAVLVLDDLHWAEKPSLLLLRHLVRSPDPTRLLVIGTYRDTELDRAHPLAEVLADLRREDSVERLALSGLDVDGVAELLARLSGERTDGREAEFAQLLWSETEGNPFFVGEILASLVESGRLVQRDGVWTSDLDTSDLAIPEGVREVVGRRLSRLSAATNAVLSLASVIGHCAEVDLLVALSDLGEDAVLDAVDEASRAALLRELASGAYEFTHALVRSTLYNELSAARRARRHRQVAETLEARGADPATLAYHFGRSGGADPRALAYAEAAGEAAADQLAFDQAVAFYTQAVETADDLHLGDTRRAGLLISLGTAQRLAGLAVHRETLLGAAALARDLGDADLLARAALANTRGFFSTAGQRDDARVEALEAALAAVGPEDSTTRARLMAVLASELVFGEPDQRRFDLADEALAMARRLGDDHCLVEVWNAQRAATWAPGRIPALAAEYPGLGELAERVGDAQQIVLAANWGYSASFQMGDIEAVDRMLERMEQIAEETNNPSFRWMVAAYRCSRMMLSSTGDEIERAATEALQLAQESGQPDAFVLFASQFAAARLNQGRIAEIVELIRQQVIENPGLPAWRASLAASLARVGEHEQARRVVDDLMADPADPFPDDGLWLVGHTYLGEAVSTVGSPAQAARQYEVLVPFAGWIPGTGTFVKRSVTLDLATLAARAGRSEIAERHFADAAAQHTRLSAPIWLAETNLRWGQFLLDGGDTERARILLTRARDTAARMGCVDLAAMASDLLVGHRVEKD
ncbi:MAG TPA: AAA family ATPase [Acidimicrobiales bacterium]|nr:AAA family ATPase [Acidimicrobiales bacterium]